MTTPTTSTGASGPLPPASSTATSTNQAVATSTAALTRGTAPTVATSTTYQPLPYSQAPQSYSSGYYPPSSTTSSTSTSSTATAPTTSTAAQGYYYGPTATSNGMQYQYPSTSTSITTAPTTTAYSAGQHQQQQRMSMTGFSGTTAPPPLPTSSMQSRAPEPVNQGRILATTVDAMRQNTHDPVNPQRMLAKLPMQTPPGPPLSGFEALTNTDEMQAKLKKQAELRANQEMLPKSKIKELLDQLDNSQGIDEDALELVRKAAEEFVGHVVTASCKLAKHRDSTTLQAQDVLLHLERNWNIVVPGLVHENLKITRRTNANSYKDPRLAMIQEDIKKSGGLMRKRSKLQRQ